MHSLFARYYGILNSTVKCDLYKVYRYFFAIERESVCEREKREFITQCSSNVGCFPAAFLRKPSAPPIAELTSRAGANDTLVTKP